MARFYQYNDNSYILPKEVLKIIKTGVPKVSHHPERDALLIETGWETGGRVSEVLGLVPEHVLEDSIVLTNLKQRYKGKPPEKLVVATTELCDWLRRYCDHENIGRGQWVFHAVNDKTKVLSRVLVHRMITAASEAAGVFRLGKANSRTGGRYKGISYHVLRHSYAVYMLRFSKMEDVKKQLGHSTILSTQAYADVAFSDVRARVAKAGVHLYHPSG